MAQNGKSSRGPTVTRKRCIVHPQNSNGLGEYSANNGFPSIEYLIAARPGFLDPQSFRHNFTVSVRNSDTQALPSNDPNAGAASATNGVALGNGRIGGAQVFKELRISNLLHRSIETITAWNRYQAGTLPYLHDGSAYSNNLNLCDPFMNEKSTTTALTSNQTCTVSQKLNCGLFSGRGISLDAQKGTNGLQIQFSLADGSEALNGYWKYGPFSSPSGASQYTPVNAFNDAKFEYILTDCFLSFDVLLPDDQFWQQQPAQGLLSYLSVESIHSVLMSGDQSLNMTIPSAKVVSVSTNLIPQKHYRSYNADSMRLCQPETNPTATLPGTPAPVTQVSYYRGGFLEPYTSALRSAEQAQNGAPQAQIMEPSVNAISQYENRSDALNTYTSRQIANSETLTLPRQALSYLSQPDPFSMYSYGAPMTDNKSGISYKGKNYTIRLQSGLVGNTPNDAFTFALASNILQYSANGLSVAS